eukprot:CAMPEP_0202916978 /NCGR_PEP_ID=MMETSP1392-20130828/69946_1 /ASSEMBLY_ACC=CAM_ASM_000868 /TAXON_ID=225041 /ORGANISM="Chlamydomonas chlamydogama, Strain SAG 11-48b" /LENGTH=40 /DNA_ID= /DNA_START= /DNA_END= /DNA_ORIENTATION=
MMSLTTSLQPSATPSALAVSLWRSATCQALMCTTGDDDDC